MFHDRKDAGGRLAPALRAHQKDDPLVLAIPRGGVEVGFHVALGLKAPLDILVARKLPLPGNPEAGFGAVAEVYENWYDVSDEEVLRIMDEYYSTRTVR